MADTNPKTPYKRKHHGGKYMCIYVHILPNICVSLFRFPKDKEM